MTINPFMKQLSLGVAAIAMCFAVGCASKKTATDAGADAAGGDSSIESTPMSFDASGSDSGSINGLSSINFEYDRSTLTSGAKKKLQGNADWMKNNGNVKLQIEGHCDSRGSIEYNLSLGERRANAVREYMVSLGVASNRLSIISYGKEKPLDDGDSEAAHVKNRRANFVPLQ